MLGILAADGKTWRLAGGRTALVGDQRWDAQVDGFGERLFALGTGHGKHIGPQGSVIDHGRERAVRVRMHRVNDPGKRWSAARIAAAAVLDWRNAQSKGLVRAIAR